MASGPVDNQRLKFVLQYLLNARQSGRSQDHDGNHARADIVKVANDLYDKAVESCTYPEEPKG